MIALNVVTKTDKMSTFRFQSRYRLFNQFPDRRSDELRF